jgi:hypothetical protein
VAAFDFQHRVGACPFVSMMSLDTRANHGECQLHFSQEEFGIQRHAENLSKISPSEWQKWSFKPDLFDLPGNQEPLLKKKKRTNPLK